MPNYVPSPGLNPAAAKRTTIAAKPKRVGIPDAPWQVGLAPPPPHPTPHPTPHPAAPPADPFAPLTDAQIQQRAAASITAQTSPVLDAIKALFAQQRTDLGDAYTRRMTAGSDAVTGYSRALAGDLGQYMDRAKAAYGDAQGAQTSADQAVSSELRNTGSQVADALTSRLGGAGFDPAMVASLADKASSTAAGAGAAGFARGTAELSKLIGEGAHAAEYTGSLPQIAGLTGLDTIKKFVAQLNSEQADKEAQLGEQQTSAIGDVTSKVPGATASLIESMNNAELQKALARQSGLLKTKPVFDPTASGRLGYRVDQYGNKIGGKITPLPGYHVGKDGTVVKDAKPKAAPQPKIVHTADGSVIAVNPTTGATIATISGPRPPKAPKPTKPTTFKGTDGRTYIYDPKTGTAKPIAGQSAPKPPTAKGDTVAAQRWHAEALGGARHYHQPWKDKNGDTQPPLTWQQYLTAAEQRGIPAAVAIEEGKKVYSQAEIKQGLIPGGG